jgi:Tol biopolymer transport system component
LTDESGEEFWGIWTPGGDSVVYHSTRREGPFNLYVKPSDGTGAPRRLTEDSDHHQIPYSISSDGRVLAFQQADTSQPLVSDIWTLSLDGQREPRPFLETEANEIHPAISPDGRSLAYASNVSGQYMVYLRPFPGPGDPIQVSPDPGWQPAWSANGRTLFFRTAREMWAARVQPGARLAVGPPRPVFEGTYLCNNWEWGRRYDVSGDGSRFVMARNRAPPPPPTEFVVVLNWFTELEEKVPTR